MSNASAQSRWQLGQEENPVGHGGSHPSRGCLSLMHEFVSMSPVRSAGSWQGQGCFNLAKCGLVSRHRQGCTLGQFRSPVRV